MKSIIYFLDIFLKSMKSISLLTNQSTLKSMEELQMDPEVGLNNVFGGFVRLRAKFRFWFKYNLEETTIKRILSKWRSNTSEK